MAADEAASAADSAGWAEFEVEDTNYHAGWAEHYAQEALEHAAAGDTASADWELR
ncbi:MAG: hypothetical protein WAW17_20985 [Rhodococcus sp. (in: high G+C Gram-positive bacteria)]|uniref:hypothetical protein n=1 Tax=Rhodococcus sp. TaxID=1831 RepID=UPI003BB10292